ncbi:hypothetical protein V865_003178 [Kwoniella europaea PYCC6329]|uniref:Uncharacterized protein n=1 Tax=Kwoniella europaea PYCC6329 TaxID=1423913 RepID=A0AAX4KF31_9TREE
MAYPSSSSSSSFGSTPQDSRSESFSRSTHQDGSNIQLPPLRLPPIRSALPGNASTTLPSPSLPISLRSFDGPTRDRQPHMDGHR